MLFVSFIGCSPSYVQLYRTQPNNSVSTDSTYRYETDSLVINYSFWYDKGIMAFSIYNKLPVPIYIDWKRSSFISNIYKFNYWSDEVISKGIGVGKSMGLSSSSGASYGGIFRYNGPVVIPYLTVSGSNTVSANLSASAYVSKTIKPERITFIPPKSIIYMSPYYLTEKDYLDKSNTKQTVERRADKPKRKKTTIYSKEFNENNSPLVFRNFLTISTSESFTSEAYVDNGFFVNRILFIDKRHFDVWQFDNKGKTIYLNKYKRGVDFFRNTGSYINSSN